MKVAVVLEASRSKLEGYLRDDVVDVLRKQLSYRVQGAWFSPRFQNHQWDGRKHFFTEVGHVFPTGLAGRLIGLLELLQIEYEVVDRRPVGADYQAIPMQGSLTLRDYQVSAVRTAIASGCGVLRVATGGGKTIIGASIIAELERPSIFLVHRLDLLRQVVGVFKQLVRFPEMVGTVGGGVYDPRFITAMTMQTAAVALGVDVDEELEPDDASGARAHAGAILRCLRAANVIVVDECHHTPAETFFNVIQGCAQASYRYGLSATDWRDDGAELMIEAGIGPRIVNIPLSGLIALGWLVPAHVTMYDIPEPHGVTVANSWQSHYAKLIVHNPELNQKVCDINAAWYDEGRTILTLVTQIIHGQRLTEALNARSIETVFLSGKDDPEYREKILDDVRAKRLRSLVATSIADEGLDLPALDAVNLAGGGRSSTKIYQRIGRTLRPAPGKEYGLVADYRVAGSEWLDEHANIRERIYKSEKGFELTELSLL